MPCTRKEIGVTKNEVESARLLEQILENATASDIQLLSMVATEMEYDYQDAENVSRLQQKSC